MSACVHAESHRAYEIIGELGFCGCGSPENNLAVIAYVLKNCPLYENHAKVYDYLGIATELVLGVIDRAGLIEHGSSIGGSWITPKGERFLDVITRRDYEDIIAWGSLCSDCPAPARRAGGDSK